MKRCMLVAAVLGATLLLAGYGAAAPAPPAAPAPGANHHLFLRRHPRMPTGAAAPFANAIIGNKRTHVYHLPGDTGNLPSPQNRVYFRTEAQARAAGYHAAGHKGAGGASRTVHPRMKGMHMRGLRTPPGSPPTPALPPH